MCFSGFAEQVFCGPLLAEQQGKFRGVPHVLAWWDRWWNRAARVVGEWVTRWLELLAQRTH